MRELHRFAVRQTANGRLLLSGALLVGAGASLASCDAATVFTVNSTSDEGEDSLRAAVTRANQISASGVSGIVIEVQAGTYELTRCAADDDNASGDLDLTTNIPVLLIGKAPNVVIKQSCAGERVLDARGGGLVSLSNLTITGGNVTGGTASNPASGGGVRASANLVLERARVEDNSATGAAGVAGPAGGQAIAGAAALGGGVYVAGALVARDSVIASNTATGGSPTVPSEPNGVAAAGGSAEGGGIYARRAIDLRRIETVPPEPRWLSNLQA